MWLSLLFALSAHAQDYTCDVVPFLAKPFDGEFPTSGFFDHDPKGPQQRQTTPWGTTTWGKAGHDGVDWPMKKGTPILAAADGVVIEGSTKTIRCSGKGKVSATVVRLAHTAPNGQRYLTGYLHLSEEFVEPGQEVKQGDLIGKSGNTGCSSGPHLHFAVTLVQDLKTDKGVKVDPYGWQADFPDPRLALGSPSAWLWEEGKSPLLYKTIGSSKAPTGKQIEILRMSGTAWRDHELPNQEWVEIGLGENAPMEEREIGGLELRNAVGDAYVFPKGTRLRKGQPLRVYSGVGEDTETALFWGQEHGVWNDATDCAHLVSPRGTLVDSQHWGRRKEGLCHPFGGPAPIEDPDSPDLDEASD